MAELFGVISGAGGIFSLTMQIGTIVARFCSDWKEAPKEVEEFRREIGSLCLLLDATRGLLDDPEFRKAVEKRSSVLQDQLDAAGGVKTTTRELFDESRQQLEEILGNLRDCEAKIILKNKKGVIGAGKQVKGMSGRIKTTIERKKGGEWERVKAAISAPATREAIQKTYKRCELFNSIVTLDAHQLATEIRSLILDTNQLAGETRSVGLDTRQLAAETRIVAMDTHQLAAQGKTVGLDTYQLAAATRLDVRTLVTRRLSKDDEEILDWLSKEDYGAQFSDFEKRCVEGTGKWFLDLEIFKEWKDGKLKVPTIVCMGMPGAGKTMTATIVLRDLLEGLSAETGTGLAYLYCNYKRHHNSDAASLLRALLRQLARQLYSGLPAELKELHNTHKRHQTTPTLLHIQKALATTMEHYARVFIVVDALDECPSSEGVRQRLISSIQDLQRDLAERNKTSLSTLFTSRQIPDIESKFEGSPKVEIRAKEEDVRRYIEELVHNDELPSFVRSDADLREEVILKITKAADGMFQLASLHVRALFGSMTKAILRSKLESLPIGDSGYDVAYNSIMERIENSRDGRGELAKKVLSWICYSKEPLSNLQLQDALKVTLDGARIFDLDDLPDLEPCISACFGLITETQPEGIVRMVHYTAQEFFGRNGARFFPEGNRMIAEVCLTGMLSDFISGNIRDAWRLDHYAKRYWYRHAQNETRLDGNLLNLLLATFLSDEGTLMLSNSLDLDQYCPHSLDAPYKYYAIIYPLVEGRAVSQNFRRVQLAAIFGLSHLVHFFLSDCSFTAASWKGSDAISPLLYAIAGHGDDDLAFELLEKGFEDEQALPLAAAVRRYELLKFLLLQDGMVLNTPLISPFENRYVLGRTALSFLVENATLDLVELMLTKAYGERERASQTLGKIEPSGWREKKAGGSRIGRSWNWPWKRYRGQKNPDKAKHSSQGRVSTSQLVKYHSNLVPESKGGLLISRASFPQDAEWVLLSAARGQSPGDEAINSTTIRVDRAGEASKPLILWAIESSKFTARSTRSAIILLLLDTVESSTGLNIPLPADESEGGPPQTSLFKFAISLWPRYQVRTREALPFSNLRKSRCEFWRSIMRRDSVAVPVSDLDVLERMLECTWRSESNPNLLIHWGSDLGKRTPISLAAEFGFEEMFARLLELGANPYEKPERNQLMRTPLSYAAEGGYEKIANICLNLQDVDPNSKNHPAHPYGGRNTLSYAADLGHDSMVSTLLACDGIEVDAQDVTTGRTPLSFAAENGHDNIVRILLNTEGVQLHTPDQHGITPLAYAAANLQISTVRLLLECCTKLGLGANPFSAYKEGAKSAFILLVTSSTRKLLVRLNPGSELKFNHTEMPVRHLRDYYRLDDYIAVTGFFALSCHQHEHPKNPIGPLQLVYLNKISDIEERIIPIMDMFIGLEAFNSNSLDWEDGGYPLESAISAGCFPAVQRLLEVDKAVVRRSTEYLRGKPFELALLTLSKQVATEASFRERWIHSELKYTSKDIDVIVKYFNHLAFDKYLTSQERHKEWLRSELSWPIRIVLILLLEFNESDFKLEAKQHTAESQRLAEFIMSEYDSDLRRDLIEFLRPLLGSLLDDNAHLTPSLKTLVEDLASEYRVEDSADSGSSSSDSSDSD